MAKKYLDYDGLSYFWSQIKNLWALASHTHTKNQITDFPTSMPPTSHTHGQISNGGAISTNVDIATGDRIIISDSSNSSILKGTSISFDTATSGTDKKALTQAGTWQTFLTSADVPEGASASNTKPKMDSGSEGTVGTETAFARGDHIHPIDTSRAPVSHASTATTYGVGNATKYGHVKLSDSYNSSIDNTKGTAATPKAVEAALAQANDYADGVAGDTNVLEGVQMNGTDLTIDANKKVNVPVFTGATTSANGTVGLVPAPRTTDVDRFSVLVGAGGWRHLAITDSSGNSIMSDLAVDGSTLSLYLKSATTTSTGLMSSSDKSKLNSISMTNGVIDSSCLPSFVDDVIEAYARANQTELGSTWLATGSATGTAITPEAGKIYVLMNSSTNYEANTQFRWGGTAYVKLSDGGVSAITNAEIDTILAS